MIGIHLSIVALNADRKNSKEVQKKNQEDQKVVLDYKRVFVFSSSSL